MPLLFPSSPVNGQTITYEGNVYIYRSAITAWDLQANVPPNHGSTHSLTGVDPITIDKLQVTGLTSDIVQTTQYGALGSTLQNMPARVLAAENLMKQAVWWIDATHSSSSSQTIRNLGWAGSSLDPIAGASTNSEASDPTHVSYLGEAHIYFPGVAGNTASVPDSSDLDVTGDFDIRAKIAPDQWSGGAASQRIIGKYGAANNRSFMFSLLTDGTLQLIWHSTAATQHIATSSVSVTVPNGEPIWVRVAVDVNVNATETQIFFYTSLDGITWTQLGTTQTVAAVTALFATNEPVEIGNVSGNSAPFSGKVFRAQLCNGINGVPVLDVDTSVINSGATQTFTANTGQTVTINRPTTGKKAIAVVNSSWLLGTDEYISVQDRWLEYTGTAYAYIAGTSGVTNYLQVPDAANLDITNDIDIRVRVALDDWTPATEQWLINKPGAYGLSVTTTGNLKLTWNNGSTTLSATSTVPTGVTNGDIKWVRATLDADNPAGYVVAFSISDLGSSFPTELGTSVVGVGTTSIAASANPLYIGSDDAGAGADPITGKFYRLLVFNGISGVNVLDVDIDTNFPQRPATVVNTFTATTGQTVTISRDTTSIFPPTGIITYSGYAQPTTTDIIPSARPLLDFTDVDSFTIMAVVRSHATQPTNARIISKEYLTANDPKYMMAWGNNGKPYVLITDGVDSSSTALSGGGRSSYSYGQVGVFAATVDRNTNTITEYFNGSSVFSTSMAAVGSMFNRGTFRVGAASFADSNYADMEVMGVAIFRKSLSASEISLASNYYLGRVA